jgi:hypothetical protein
MYRLCIASFESKPWKKGRAETCGRNGGWIRMLVREPRERLPYYARISRLEGELSPEADVA